MTDRSPILISIPHGGFIIPPEVRDMVNLGMRDVILDGDTLATRLFDFREDVEALVETPVARAIIDVNRSPDDRPPENVDGVVKKLTTSGIPIYREGRFPDEDLIEILLDRYYFPYHEELENVQERGEIRLCLDCHTMLPISPCISREPGLQRPIVCLSNGGDERGRSQDDGGTTCPPEWIISMARSFQDHFDDYGEVRINDPFKGGFISRYHHDRKRIPWIQIEINRGLYMEDPLDLKHLQVSGEKIEELRGRISSAIEQFCSGEDFNHS